MATDKSRRKKYAEFRVFVEYKKRGKYAIRHEFVPSVAAWLLMHGRVYQRAIDAMNVKLARDTVPGLAESIAGYEKCQQHLQMLLNSLTTNFHGDDWKDAVAEVCQLMKITPDSGPLDEIAENVFNHQITELPNGG